MTGASPHACVGTFTATGGATGSPLLATANQWGQTTFPPTAMSRLAVSRQARDLLDGIITVHRELPVCRPEDSGAVPKTHPQDTAIKPTSSYGAEQHRAALDKRRADIADLAGVATELAVVDRRAAELDQRITQLLALVSAP